MYFPRLPLSLSFPFSLLLGMLWHSKHFTDAHAESERQYKESALRDFSDFRLRLRLRWRLRAGPFLLPRLVAFKSSKLATGKFAYFNYSCIFKIDKRRLFSGVCVYVCVLVGVVTILPASGQLTLRPLALFHFPLVSISIGFPLASCGICINLLLLLNY